MLPPQLGEPEVTAQRVPASYRREHSAEFVSQMRKTKRCNRPKCLIKRSNVTRAFLSKRS
jgi:hypothetical protein